MLKRDNEGGGAMKCGYCAWRNEPVCHSATGNACKSFWFDSSVINSKIKVVNEQIREALR